uniref:Uncharacterized protein n=1 Tax=Acrobeloides nanus TaxID=290746 RepID=A0A914E6E3_9BILA
MDASSLCHMQDCGFKAFYRNKKENSSQYIESDKSRTELSFEPKEMYNHKSAKTTFGYPYVEVSKGS